MAATSVSGSPGMSLKETALAPSGTTTETSLPQMSLGLTVPGTGSAETGTWALTENFDTPGVTSKVSEPAGPSPLTSAGALALSGVTITGLRTVVSLLRQVSEPTM